MVDQLGVTPKTTVGIIGFGRFSQLMIRYLSEDCEVTVYDRRERAGDISRLGGHSGSLAAACACDIVIPAVPISAMKPTLIQIGPRLKPHTLVVDICSVKTYPVQWMLEILPANVDILATHPMFGPDSAAVTLVPWRNTAPSRWILTPMVTNGCYILWKRLPMTPGNYLRTCITTIRIQRISGIALWRRLGVSMPASTKGA